MSGRKVICNRCLWYNLKEHICTQGRMWKTKASSDTCSRAKEFTVPERIAVEARKSSCPFI